MDFKSRFKGKMTIMNKDGVIGMVSQPSQPIAKTNQYYTEKDEPSPIQKQSGLFSDGIRETKSHIFTNIQTTPSRKNATNYSQKFSNVGSQVIKQQHVKTEQINYDDQKLKMKALSFKLQNDFNQLDMDEYEIVAIPKKMLGQLRQQISVDRYGAQNNFPSDKKLLLQYQQFSPEGTTNYQQQSPLLKKQNTVDPAALTVSKPIYPKSSTQKIEVKNKIIQQAGVGTLRYNSYSKR